jgi:ParB-like chromosome segregation protein Spo0J
LKIETVAIESVQFDPANVRKHGEKNLGAIKSSLLRFGQQKPIVVDAKGIVRAGNGTLAALKALEWKEVRIVRSTLEGSEATAYAIADNRTAELAEWDDDALAQTLAALQIEDEKLAVATGFLEQELRALTDIFQRIESAPESSAKEIDVDGFQLECRCPKCGFEFNPKT